MTRSGTSASSHKSVVARNDDPRLPLTFNEWALTALLVVLYVGSAGVLAVGIGTSPSFLAHANTGLYTALAWSSLLLPIPVVIIRSFGKANRTTRKVHRSFLLGILSSTL